MRLEHCTQVKLIKVTQVALPTELHISQSSIRSLHSLVPRSRHLRHLNVSGSPYIRFRGVPVTRLAQLEVLDLSDTHIQHADLLCLRDHWIDVQRLKRLDLSDCTLNLEMCQVLSTLTLTWLNVSNSSLDRPMLELVSTPSLRTLLVANTQLDFSCLSVLQRLELGELNVSGCCLDPIEPVAASEPRSIRHLCVDTRYSALIESWFTCTEWLELHFVGEKGGKVAPKFLVRPSVSRLCLDAVSLVDFEWPRLPCLTQLSITGCQFDGLESWPHLLHLDLSSTKCHDLDLTPYRLVSLRVNECDWFQDRHLGDIDSERLEIFECSGCSLSQQALSAFFARMLRPCSLGLADLGFVPTLPRSVVSLDLSSWSSSSFNLEEVRPLFALPHLETLSLQGHSIDHDELMRLKVRHRRFQLLCDTPPATAISTTWSQQTSTAEALKREANLSLLHNEPHRALGLYAQVGSSVFNLSHLPRQMLAWIWVPSPRISSLIGAFLDESEVPLFNETSPEQVSDSVRLSLISFSNSALCLYKLASSPSSSRQALLHQCIERCQLAHDLVAQYSAAYPMVTGDPTLTVLRAKVHYRHAQALFDLGSSDDARVQCELGLELRAPDSEIKALQSLLAKSRQHIRQSELEFQRRFNRQFADAL